VKSQELRLWEIGECSQLSAVLERAVDGLFVVATHLSRLPSDPPRVSDETALETAGAEAVYYHRSLTGASNGQAKEKLGFAPRPLLWKS
jgi:hypothetical protein